MPEGTDVGWQIVEKGEVHLKPRVDADGLYDVGRNSFGQTLLQGILWLNFALSRLDVGRSLLHVEGHQL